MSKHIALCLAVLCFFGISASAQETAPVETATAHTWDDATLDLFATIPIQDGGRVKPLSTYADFTLLRLNGKRSVTDLQGNRLSPMAWMLDCLYYPETAKQYGCFMIDNTEALTAIGVTPPDGKPRGRYSYNVVASGRDRLASLGQQYAHIEDKDRSQLEGQIVRLSENVTIFEWLAEFRALAETTFTFEQDSPLYALYPDEKEYRLSEVLAKGSELRAALRTGAGGQMASMGDFLDKLDHVSRRSSALDILPPSDPEVKEWASPFMMMSQTFGEADPPALNIASLAALENLLAADPASPELATALEEYRANVISIAESRGEYEKVPMEVAYYKADYFFKSLIFFIISFLLVAVSWVVPRSRKMNWVAVGSMLIPLGYLLIGITYRCILRGRPPVTTLYETILFITAVAVVSALFIEWLNRQRVALALGAILGTLGMFLAYRYEISDGKDTMPQLVAVLDTNFWLMTHVTTVTAGYAAGLLASAIAHIFLLGKAFGFKKNDAGFYRSLGRMTYGVVCFTLLFSLVGTVLGGIWANYSWGRFWGWDPKENGALMIVLWNLMILHGRLGRYIRDFGIAMAAVAGGMVVSFSWWGVNVLGVGLHSYGFTAGIWNMLYAFWSVEAVVLFLGCIAYFRSHTPPATPPSSEGPKGKKGKKQKVAHA